MDKFLELWNLQERFTKRFWNTHGGMPDTSNEKILTVITKDYALHLVSEIIEIVHELPWKMHRTIKKEAIRTNILEEIIDAQKFIWGLAQCWDFTPEEFEQAFRQKSAVVEQRFDQEQSLPKLKDQPCILVDIDGILTNYPWCYLDWVTKYYRHTPAEYKALDMITKEQIKRAYRQSGAKRDLPVLPGSKGLLDQAHAAGINIILITMRPYAEYYRIYPDTLEWLKKNHLRYDAILWARDKGLEALENFRHVLLAVDDDPKNTELYKRAGIKAVLVSPPDGTTQLIQSDLWKDVLRSTKQLTQNEVPCSPK